MRKTSLKSSIGSVTFVILIAKLFGFLRDMIMAGCFGASVETDAYNAAYSLFYLPVLIATSIIDSSVVPEYRDALAKRGKRVADRFFTSAMHCFLIIALIAGGLMFAFASPLTKLVYPGFASSTGELTVKLMRTMLPALVFMIAALMLASLLDAMKLNAPSQLCSLPLNAVLILAALTLSGTSGIIAQAWGLIVGGLLEVIVLVPFLRGRWRWEPLIDLNDSSLRCFLKRAPFAAIAMGVGELNHFIDRILASGLEAGSISAMNYAFRLIMFALGILCVPVTRVKLTHLSELSAKGETEKMREDVRASMRDMLVCVLPITVLAVICSNNIIALAYQRGSFSPADTLVTGGVFLCYALGLPFFCVRNMLYNTFHAFKDNRTPCYVACISVCINIVLNIILRKLMGVNGLALATAIAALSIVPLLFVLLSKRISGIFTKSYAMSLARLLLSCLPAIVCGIVLKHVFPAPHGTFRVFLWLCGVVGASMIVYLPSAAIIGGINWKRWIKRYIKG